MKRAIALRYDPDEQQAPEIVSAGDGLLAEHIERAALHYGIPVVRDVPLAAALSELAVGEQIPEALYEAVAALLNELAGGGES
ncbi:MAG TPA: EscU/YscU/HrcU family type III secretion system export apparatus switch protein [Polyangiaceae bacterium]